MMGISWLMRPSMSNDASLIRGMRITSVVCFLVPIGIAIWLSRLADPVPDFLSAISRKFFERDGFCFLFSVEKAASSARMAVYYQNRFTKPCNAKVFIGPTPKAFANLEGLPKFEFKVACGAGEFGKQSLAWSVPLRFQGKKILWDVAAQARFPSGRGELLRGRNGATVGDHLVGTGEEAVRAVSGLVLSAAHLHASTRSARVELILPDKLEPLHQKPADLQSQTIWKLGDPITPIVSMQS